MWYVNKFKYEWDSFRWEWKVKYLGEKLIGLFIMENFRDFSKIWKWSWEVWGSYLKLLVVERVGVWS